MTSEFKVRFVSYQLNVVIFTLVSQAARDSCSVQDYYNMQIRLPAYYIRGKLSVARLIVNAKFY